ncbi:MAG TPA: 4Fe-4S dicluster domain-containing protein [Anaerovoracaceae bacterium]|nr:4Fe-4S dicluster domain-containing protein [Anaerovoracaceae bacterium]
MSQLLITKKFVKEHKELKLNQKAYLKAHKAVKGKYPKAKLGKVIKEKEGFKAISGHGDLSNPTAEFESPQQIIDYIREHKAIGLSGSCFPTSDKLETVLNSKAEKKYFVVNSVACDPGLIHDAWLLANQRDIIDMGIEVISNCIDFEKVVIGSPETVPARYPMGEEHILIKQLLGIDIPKEEVPAEQGILVLNVQTVYSIARLFDGKENNKRYITIADLDTGLGKTVQVQVGQTIGEVLQEYRYTFGDKEIYTGMGIMDAELASSDKKITLGTAFIGTIKKGSVPIFDNEAKCKGCGKCTKNCPASIKVTKAMKAIDKGDTENLEQFDIDKCIECGTCAYFCGAGKNPMEIIKKYTE